VLSSAHTVEKMLHSIVCLFNVVSVTYLLFIQLLSVDKLEINAAI